MAFFKKAMNYLGLGPDDAYDEYDLPMEPAPGRAPRSSYGPESNDSGTVRTVPASAASPRAQNNRATADAEQPAVGLHQRRIAGVEGFGG